MDLYCGATDPDHHPPLYVQIKPKQGADCPNNADGVGPVLIHELAHVIGFGDGTFEGNKGPTPVPHDCVIFLAGEGNLNTRPCAQEVEYIYAGYALVSPTVAATISDKTVLTGPTIATHTVTVEAKDKVGNSIVGVGEDSPNDAPLQFAYATDPAGDISFRWISDRPSVATVIAGSNGSATITAVAEGQAVIRAQITSTSRANTVVGTLARLVGDSVVVTVLPPPPPPPPGSGFRVSSISGPAAPITQAGSFWLTAQVVEQPAGYLETNWRVTYSNGVIAAVNTGFRRGAGYLLEVPEGSYSISVTATARSDGYTSGSLTQKWPVCTGSGDGGGGGDPLAVAGDPAEATPNAVAGC